MMYGHMNVKKNKLLYSGDTFLFRSKIMNDMIIPGKDKESKNNYVAKQLPCPCYDL